MVPKKDKNRNSDVFTPLSVRITNTLNTIHVCIYVSADVQFTRQHQNCYPGNNGIVTQAT